MSAVLNRILKINRPLTNGMIYVNQRLSICISYTSVILTTCVYFKRVRKNLKLSIISAL